MDNEIDYSTIERRLFRYSNGKLQPTIDALFGPWNSINEFQTFLEGYYNNTFSENMIPNSTIIGVYQTNGTIKRFEWKKPTNDSGSWVAASANVTINGKTGETITLTKSDINGLNNVDNTADINKNVNSAVKDGNGNNISSTYETKTDAQAKIDALTKNSVGLGYVDNTADVDKVVKGANEDGSGNVISVTYETKTDATTKQTGLQTDISAIQTTVNNLIGLEGTNFAGFSVDTTEADALAAIPTKYTTDGYTNELVWYLVGDGIDNLKAYSYDGTNTPVLVSSKVYDFTDFSGVSADVNTLRQDLNALGPKISQNETKLREIKNAVQGLDGDTLYIVDGEGNVVAYIGAQGLVAVEVQAQGKKLSNIPNDILESFYPNKFYVVDGNGNVVAYIDDDGLHAIGIYADNLNENKWYGKVLATYGDSVTALNGGDFTKPYSSSSKTSKWGGKVADYFKFRKLYNRGIGSTCFKYRNHGGQVAWVKTATGVYVDRNDSYNYDNYEGNVTIPSDCTPIRGDGSSWLRITTMFPSAIKDEIDVVLIMYHNDFHQDMDTDASWVENDTTDPEWAASSYYETYGGDYNIASVKGGIASVIMKMQAWIPNALLVLMTPISGVYINGNADVKDLENVESAKMKKLAECVKDVAFRMSIPCIDVYGNDGINSLNKVLRNYITDGIHPYSDAGCKQIARAIASGLSSIVPNF